MTIVAFVRLAIQHGTPLMPLYIFGENQLYRRVQGGRGRSVQTPSKRARKVSSS